MAGCRVHAAQTFTTSSLICLGSLLIRSISLVWLSFTNFSSLVLYWYWSAMVGLQVLDEESEDKPLINLRAAASVRFWPWYHYCAAPADMPGDSCCRRPDKNGGLTPPPHTHRESLHSHTCTQCNAHRHKRNVLKENPGLCHISHRVVGLTGPGLHRGPNFHSKVRQKVSSCGFSYYTQS